MSTLNKLRLYTQPGCGYCVHLKKKLDDLELEYVEINIKEVAGALEFMKQKGHRTVPQLYYNHERLNGDDTTQLTSEQIKEKVESLQWNNIDGGIEQGI